MVKVEVTSDLKLYFGLGFESFQGRIFSFGQDCLQRHSHQMWHLIRVFNKLL